MCGKETDLYATIIEETELNVCSNCSKFGKVLREVKKPEPIKKKKEKIVVKQEEPEIIQVVVEDYAERLRKAREKLGLKQKDFAKKISERASLLHNFETGKIEPTLKIAQKLEKLLKIKLIEEIEEKPEKLQKTKSEEFTVGDFIKVKK